MRVIPLTDAQLPVARSLADQLLARDYRVGVDTKSEKVGAKIRRAQQEKTPYMLIVGPKEAEAGTVSVRSRANGDEGVMTLAEFEMRLAKENVPG